MPNHVYVFTCYQHKMLPDKVHRVRAGRVRDIHGALSSALWRLITDLKMINSRATEQSTNVSEMNLALKKYYFLNKCIEIPTRPTHGFYSTVQVFIVIRVKFSPILIWDTLD